MIDAAAYGKALFELSQEAGEDKRVQGELELVRRALRAGPAITGIMDAG